MTRQRPDSLPADKGNARSVLRRNGRAFTLIELMVVIAVISILVGALMPEFSGTFATMQMSAATGEVGDMMAYCYSAASAQQTDYRLNFEPDLKRVWLTREAEDETGVTSYQLLQTPGMQAFVLPDALSFDAEDMAATLNAGEEGSYYIQFRRDGTADFCRVRLLSRSAGVMEITLNGITGRVSIRELPPEAVESPTPGETPPPGGAATPGGGPRQG